jgi:soluble lytic murein transglycosylase
MLCYGLPVSADVFECADGDAVPRFSDVADSRSCRRILVDGPPIANQPPARPSQPSSAQRRALLAPDIALAARRYGLPEHLLEALVAVESDFRPDAVSSRGARGLTQLMPATAAMLGVADPTNVAANLDAGARHLRTLLVRFSGNTTLALAAYNAGEAAVARYNGTVPPFPETRAYVKEVERRWREKERR